MHVLGPQKDPPDGARVEDWRKFRRRKKRQKKVCRPGGMYGPLGEGLGGVPEPIREGRPVPGTKRQELRERQDLSELEGPSNTPAATGAWGIHWSELIGMTSSG